MQTLPFYVLVILGMIPSLVWLLIYLRRDCHPEPKQIIIKSFLLGIIFAPIALVFQKMFVGLGNYWPHLGYLASGSALFFLWASFVEEIVKYLGIRLAIFRDPEFDEPVDGMVYLIASGLGFAAIENVLVLMRISDLCANNCIEMTFSIWGLRFLGATLLHALSSAIVGYFVALSWFYFNHRKILTFFGVALASVFHFSFNIFQSHIDNAIVGLSYTIVLLMVMAFLVSVLFDKIKERDKSHKIKIA